MVRAVLPSMVTDGARDERNPPKPCYAHSGASSVRSLGTPANLLGWGIWISNDRFLDRMNTPAQRRAAALITQQQRPAGEAVVEEGEGAAAGGGPAGVGAAAVGL